MLTVELFGADPKVKIGPTQIIAMFAHDEGRMRDDILFGLGGGTFVKRRLELAYDRERIVLSG